jgi:hypothetical protein
MVVVPIQVMAQALVPPKMLAQVQVQVVALVPP